MNAQDFVWCGKSLSDANMIIGGINGAEGTMTPASVSFTTATTPTSNVKRFVTSKYEETLQFELSICKNPCYVDSDKDMYIDTETDRYIRRWLIREDGFHRIQFDIEEGCDIYFDCYMNVTPQYLSGQIIGYTILGITNSPYPYATSITYKFNTSNDKPYQLFVNSDIMGYVYPNIKITPKESGELIFKINEDETMEPMKVFSATADSPILIDSDLSIIEGVEPNNWNWMFPRLLQDYDETLNTITTSIPCDIELKYTPRRKIVL